MMLPSPANPLESDVSLTRAIVTDAGVAIIATSLTGVITTFNPAAEQLLGYSEAEMVGVATPIVFHDAAEVADRAARLSERYGERIAGFATFVRPLKDHSVQTEAWSYIHKDGHRISVMLTLSTLKNESGEPVGYLGVARDRSAYYAQLAKEQASAKMADIVRTSQEHFIGGQSPQQLFAKLLAAILDFTGSEYGFIGEVLNDGSAPYLKTHAITDIAWNPETRALYEANRMKGFEFRNLKTLFGAALTSRQPVIANDAANDPRRGGLPPGHPPMHSFLALPCFYGGEMVGLIGLANRDGGFSQDLIDLVAPLTSSTASLIQAIRLDLRRQASAATLADQEHRLRSILATATDCFLEVGPDGLVKEWNRRAETCLGIPRGEAIDRPVDELVRLRSAAGVPTGLIPVPRRDGGHDDGPREVVVELADGSSFPAELVTWAVPSRAGTGFCCFLRNIEERKRLEEQQRLLFQSETLLKEVHHRIKNNMQVISSLLSIQSTKLTDDHQRAVFHECRERIRAMSLIHDRLYSTGNYAEIDFADYLREMLALTVSSNKPDGCEIAISLEAAPVSIGVDRAVPLSLIASELVLNSLKHAFIGRVRGRILVRLDRRPAGCELFIGDDGPGSPQANPAGPGIGLRLIDSLARQIRGSFSLTSSGGLSGAVVRWSDP
jgi:PAS domain S-box-containing protein